MLYDHLTQIEPDASTLAVVTTESVTTWHELLEQIANLTQEFSQLQGQRVGCQLPATAAGVAILAALDKLGVRLFLLDGQMPVDQATDWCDRFKLQALLRVVDGRWEASQLDDAVPTGSPPLKISQVTILTSGTEGTPKAATYSWSQLAKPVRIVDKAARSDAADVWLLSFRVHLYAGLQVMLQAMLNGQTLVAPAAAAAPNDVLELLAQHKVTCASATPSYWRRLLLFGDETTLKRIPLRQITLGGELSDQPLLDSLHGQFPQARIIHIYATTELGRCFAVTDGRAGFPKSYLEPADLRHLDARLKVVDGQLLVQPAFGTDCLTATHPATNPETGNSSTDNSNDGTWIATGDLVIMTADRVLFAGRAGDMINVGGNKVRPAIVEAAIRTVAGVRDVRVFGQSSSIAGQLVACDLVVDQTADTADIKQQVRLACREQLQPYQCPRLINIVEQIQLSSAGKVQRN